MRSSDVWLDNLLHSTPLRGEPVIPGSLNRASFSRSRFQRESSQDALANLSFAFASECLALELSGACSGRLLAFESAQPLTFQRSPLSAALSVRQVRPPVSS